MKSIPESEFFFMHFSVFFANFTTFEAFMHLQRIHENANLYVFP